LFYDENLKILRINNTFGPQKHVQKSGAIFPAVDFCYSKISSYLIWSFIYTLAEKYQQMQLKSVKEKMQSNF
jgi:hypothetical protein